MSEKKYFWLKIETDFFNQKEIKKLRKIAGGDTYTVIYLKMALLSLKDGGFLYFEGIENNISEELALELDEERENIDVVLKFLESYKMLERIDEKEVYMSRVPEMTGGETDAAKRMRRMRKGETSQERNNVTQISNDVQECSEMFDSKSKSKKSKIQSKSNNNIKSKDTEKEHIFISENIKIVKLSQEQYDAAIEKYGKDMTLDIIYKIENYCEMHGKTYKNYLAAINTFSVGYKKTVKKSEEYEDLITKEIAELGEDEALKRAMERLNKKITGG